MARPSDPAETPSDLAETKSPLSLERLRSAMATLLGSPAKTVATSPAEPRDQETTADHRAADDGEAVVSLRGVVEAALFVGRQDGGPIDAPALAATMSDVTPAEIAAAVEELNQAYAAEGSALSIRKSQAGYQLRIDPKLERLADRLGRRVRAARLSSAALETLAVIAYRQPITAEEVSELREHASSTAISQLVRHQLVRRQEEGPTVPPRLVTTDRFLRLAGVGSLEQLPRVAELDD